MSYFSVAEDQSMGGLGCGKDCGCGQCKSGLSGLQEWYEKEAANEPPAVTPPRAQAPPPERPSPGPTPQAESRKRGKRRRRPTAPLGYYGFAEAPVISPIAEQARLQDAIRRGIRDARQLSNILFFGRHPERSSVPLRADEIGLIDEWRQIQQRIVVPALQQMFGPGNGAGVVLPGRAPGTRYY